MEKFRHELKYLVSYQMIPVIRKRLEKIMELDQHAKNGHYLISSLYFDDYDDSRLFDVASGVDERNKFRLRIYNHDKSRIMVENKFKRNNMTLKKTCRISYEDAGKLINNKYLRNIGDQAPLMKEMTYQIMAKGLHPTVIVEYKRIPFVYSGGNVRVTFDMNLISSYDKNNFFSDYRLRRPVLENQLQIMEVKYDEFLPAFIYDCLNLYDLQQFSISKYALCRRYGIKED